MAIPYVNIPEISMQSVLESGDVSVELDLLLFRKGEAGYSLDELSYSSGDKFTPDFSNLEAIFGKVQLVLVSRQEAEEAASYEEFYDVQAELESFKRKNQGLQDELTSLKASLLPWWSRLW